MLGSLEEAEPPNILYVIGELEVGGAERHLLNVSRELIRANWHVRIYSLAGDGPLRSEFQSAGATVILPPLDRKRVPKKKILRAVRLGLAALHLVYTMAIVRPRIAHFFLPEAYTIGAIAASLTRIRIRVMSRRSLNNYQASYPWARSLEVRLHRSMTAILGNSKAVVRQLGAEEGVAASHLGLIYNGIEFSDVPKGERQSVRSLMGIDDRTLVYIIVANLIPYKGHLDLVRAFGIANERIDQPWRLLLVGRDDGAGEDIRALIRELRLNGRISLLGPRTDVPRLLSASDVGLLSSHQEGFSNAILEAMAAGLPMIVTDVGGNAEAVVAGETGLVVPPHDADALAEAIVSLARNPALRKAYGDAGQGRLREQFQLESCVAKYQALYRGLERGLLPGDIPEVSYSH